MLKLADLERSKRRSGDPRSALRRDASAVYQEVYRLWLTALASHSGHSRTSGSEQIAGPLSAQLRPFNRLNGKLSPSSWRPASTFRSNQLCEILPSQVTACGVGARARPSNSRRRSGSAMHPVVQHEERGRGAIGRHDVQ